MCRRGAPCYPSAQKMPSGVVVNQRLLYITRTMSLADESPDHIHDAFFEFAAYPAYCLSSQISIGALCPRRPSVHRLWDRGMRASDIGIRPRQCYSLINRGGLCLLLIQRLLNANKGLSIDLVLAGMSIVSRRHFVGSSKSRPPIWVRSRSATLLLRLISFPLDSVLFHSSHMPPPPDLTKTDPDFVKKLTEVVIHYEVLILDF
jgi:hypothetical protein